VASLGVATLALHCGNAVLLRGTIAQNKKNKKKQASGQGPSPDATSKEATDSGIFLDHLLLLWILRNCISVNANSLGQLSDC
jgi:hypothetical protein